MLNAFADLGRAPVVDAAVIATIEAGADRVLDAVGLLFEGDPETLALWRSHGARVEGERVFLEGAWLRRVIRESAPSSFTLRARNPAHDVRIGANAPAVYAPVYGPPDVLLENGQRKGGTLALYQQLLAMVHTAPGLTNTGHMLCVPHDVPEAQRPMVMALAHLVGSDKSLMGSVASPQACAQVMDMATAAVGRAPAEATCETLHLVNATPPLCYKSNPLQCLRTIAQHGQGAMVTSYMMMGATAPVTAAGALIQGYAEVLAGLALTQLWSPGTPVVMGLFATPFSMRSMQPCFGDPVTYNVHQHAVALARHLGVPVRGDAGITASKVDDAQAGYESAFASAMCAWAKADFMLHSAGWLAQGRCVSFTKLARDSASVAHMLGKEIPNPAPMPLDAALLRQWQAPLAIA